MTETPTIDLPVTAGVEPPKSFQTEPIPRPLTPLVGRARELDNALSFLSQPDLRLITLTGPGGVGKTRLALRIASWADEDEAWDVAFVNLSAIRDAGLVRSAVADAIGIPVGDMSTLMNRLVQAIDRARLLIIIDNFEHVISEAVVVVDLLQNCPNLKILVTSRMPLHVLGEQEFTVPPLVVPHLESPLTLDTLAANDAVALFVQRARAANPQFELNERNLDVVAEICARLDGLPLALELAAARIKIFTPDSLLKRLNDRLDVLTGGPRDLPSRQRTMRDAIRWSYDLLSPAEQVVFRRLATFSGSFSLGAATEIVDFPSAEDQVADDPIDVLDCMLSLLDKSLIIRVDEGDNEYRFRMLETIREFGLRRLQDAGESAELRRRVLRYFTDLVVSFEFDLIGPNQHIILRRLDHEVGNLRLALQAGLDLGGDASADGVRLASGLWRYWLVRGQLSEGSRWLSRSLNSATDVPVGVRALALNNLGNLALELSQYTKSQACYMQSMELYQSIDDNSGMGDELNNLGLLELIQGKFDAARELLGRSLAIRRQIGDTIALPTTLSNLGDIACFEEDYDLAATYHAEALAIRREIGNKRGIAISLSNLGMVAYLRGDLDSAATWYDEGMTYAQEVDDQFGKAGILLGQGKIAVRRGDLTEGLHLLTQALYILRQMGSRRLMADVVDALAAAAASDGRFSAAARLIGSTTTMREGHQIGITHRSKTEINELLTDLHRQLGEDGFSTAFDAGKRLTLELAVDESIDLAQLIVASETERLARERAATEASAGDVAADELGLTPREREVLNLLALGMSDKEIADELYISPRTAMTHVGNILSKLGVNKRTLAASVAVRRGLVNANAAVITE
jgi:predicted ATPase/DNA-binding CsgD family transcriptional regulator